MRHRESTHTQFTRNQHTNKDEPIQQEQHFTRDNGSPHQMTILHKDGQFDKDDTSAKASKSELEIIVPKRATARSIKPNPKHSSHKYCSGASCIGRGQVSVHNPSGGQNSNANDSLATKPPGPTTQLMLGVCVPVEEAHCTYKTSWCTRTFFSQKAHEPIGLERSPSSMRCHFFQNVGISSGRGMRS